MPLKTALYDFHIKLNANMVEFAGFYLPLFYTSIQEEHLAVRNNIGVFDVSHMGNLEINSSDKENAIAFLNYLFPNDFSNIKKGKCIYTTMLNEKGKVIDDLIVNAISETRYHLVVNASNIKKDYDWIQEKSALFKNITVENKSNNHSIIAIQGPNSVNALKRLNFDVSDLNSFSSKIVLFNSSEIIVSRTGYTGEDGFECIMENNVAPFFMEKLYDISKELNIKFCGLGARDSLRLESALPLYGHELDEYHSPLQTNVAWSVKLDKECDFIGKEILLKEKDSYKEIIVGFEVLGRSIARNNMNILNKDNIKIGYVTSGTYSPFLQKSIGLAYLNKEYINESDLKIEVRNRTELIKLTKIPFYKKNKRS